MQEDFATWREPETYREAVERLRRAIKIHAEARLPVVILGQVDLVDDGEPLNLRVEWHRLARLVEEGQLHEDVRLMTGAIHGVQPNEIMMRQYINRVAARRGLVPIGMPFTPGRNNPHGNITASLRKPELRHPLGFYCGAVAGERFMLHAEHGTPGPGPVSPVDPRNWVRKNTGVLLYPHTTSHSPVEQTLITFESAVEVARDRTYNDWDFLWNAETGDFAFSVEDTETTRFIFEHLNSIDNL